jgi:type IV pilus assembly protein PilN
MIRINLLPVKAAQKKEKLKGQMLVVALTVLVAGALCGLVFMHFQGEIETVEEEISQKQQEIDSLKKTIGKVNAFKKKKKELSAKLDILEKLKANRSGPVHLLDELYKAMPEKLWLTNFTEKGGAAKIVGVGVNEETVALFMRNLEDSKYYGGVRLKQTQQVVQKAKGASSGIKFHKFELSAKITKPKAKAAKKK